MDSLRKPTPSSALLCSLGVAMTVFLLYADEYNSDSRFPIIRNVRRVITNPERRELSANFDVNAQVIEKYIGRNKQGRQRDEMEQTLAAKKRTKRGTLLN